MEEWKEYKLGEIVISVKDRINTSVLNISSYISTENMLPNKAGVTLSSSVPSGNAIKFVADDVLISNIRPYFKKIWQADRIGGCSSDVICLRAANITEPFFLYYLLSQDRFFDYVMKGSKGTKMPRGDRSQIMQWPVLLPSKNTQQRIASILKSLDDKIEVNRKINENLEQQAQALFKSWFVDFEPFKNGEFVESELGMIPKGWRVGQIKDICKFENGFAFKSDTYTTKGIYKVVTIKNVQDGSMDIEGANLISDIPNRMPDYCRLNTGDVLLSLTGNVGRCCLVIEENLLLNQRVAKIKPNVKSDLGFIYTLFRMPDFKERLISIARGTAQANLSPVETSKLSIVIPPTEIMKRYSVLSTNIYNKIICCMKESRRLAELRDTLLPKLMSGELKVNEIEK